MTDFNFVLSSKDARVLDDALTDMTAYLLKQRDTDVRMEVLPVIKDAGARIFQRRYTVISDDVHIQSKLQRYDLPSGVSVFAVFG